MQHLLDTLFIFLLPCMIHSSELDGSTGDTADFQRCQEISQKLYHSVKDADRSRLEWERYLPVYLKTTLSMPQYQKEGTGKEREYRPDYTRFNVIGPVGPACRTPMEKYGKDDDEKRACGLKNLETLNAVNTSDGKHDCVIYSVGSNNQWGFEEAIVAQTQCRVETFDCTVTPDVRPPAPIAHRVRLHRVCISDSDFVQEGRQYLSWKSVNKLTGIQTAPTFLKMDIEGYEFPVLRAIIDAGQYLPLQIAVEIHLLRMERGYRANKLTSTSELLAFIQYIYKFGGYYLIDRHDNPFCVRCTEIVLAKLDCHNHPKEPNAEKAILSNEKLQSLIFNKAIKDSFNHSYYT